LLLQVSVNDCVIKAVAMALAEVPAANCYWSDADGISDNTSVDISMAVSTDQGLITPIIKNADKLSLMEISKDAKRLALKARQNKLTPQEVPWEPLNRASDRTVHVNRASDRTVQGTFKQKPKINARKMIHKI
jgi:hypothetical protein